ncbi:MAG: UDP-N-acetylmuramoyl-L-alanyl-D-glutamate--2,6-diaminopimelate ligase [Proteobacteria bacterium]|jgi:UDP-N-acetylmuramoyl-L-alanyl-D-glutamate--2,6-diaminopimelate ligase|nr:UDP-N-acetylmuramoyl-L-alanyl-D-glutamate--2,6-diaminopimelate ligase [Pseudomonadota bacterium]
MYSSINKKIDYVSLLDLESTLKNLLKDYALVLDSRLVTAKSIFCAYKGTLNDGRNFISKAIANGAKYIITEGDIGNNLPIEHYAVDNLIQYIGLLASYKYDNPSSKFKVIGVTGTNGKTSVTHWINQIYTLLGSKSAIIGTTGAGLYPDIKDYAATTPDPITLQKLLFEFSQEKVDIVAMETSSHALEQGRVNGVQFETAIFTNLTQDHLDYHLTLENYYAAKRSLFYWHDLKNIIINIDDVYGKRLYKELENSKTRIITYGINAGDLQAKKVKVGLSGTDFVLAYDNMEYTLKVPVVGRFNIYNLLAVIAALIVDNIAIIEIVKYVQIIKPVCGRMDAIFNQESPLVIVDYAHTPDALENVLNTLREVEHKGSIYCVFGCGGDRDALKRPLMGKVAALGANQVFITTDNPRNEDPLLIIEQIIAGIPSNITNYLVEADRSLAIEKAIKLAQPNDIVLIAGKGHELYQDSKGVKHYFSDFEVAKKALVARS